MFCRSLSICSPTPFVVCALLRLWQRISLTPRAVTSDQTTRKITVFLKTIGHIESPADNVFRVFNDSQEFPDGLYLQVGVKDSGSGLNQEEREKLFERFARESEFAKSSLLIWTVAFRGTSFQRPVHRRPWIRTVRVVLCLLGFLMISLTKNYSYVCRHIVILLQGFIDVESNRDLGCTFSFSIPIERAEPQADRHPQTWRSCVFMPLHVLLSCPYHAACAILQQSYGRSVATACPCADRDGSHAVWSHAATAYSCRRGTFRNSDERSR